MNILMNYELILSLVHVSLVEIDECVCHQTIAARSRVVAGEIPVATMVWTCYV